MKMIPEMIFIDVLCEFIMILFMGWDREIRGWDGIVVQGLGWNREIEGWDV